MNQKTKNILLILLIAVLIVVFTPIFGSLYKTYFGPVSGGFFWGPAHPEYIGGFFMSYVFFITILSVVLLNYKKYIWGALLIMWPFAISLMAGDGQALISQIISLIIAFILAQIILLIHKKLKK